MQSPLQEHGRQSETIKRTALRRSSLFHPPFLVQQLDPTLAMPQSRIRLYYTSSPSRGFVEIPARMRGCKVGLPVRQQRVESRPPLLVCDGCDVAVAHDYLQVC
jgi:hypothetical protein